MTNPPETRFIKTARALGLKTLTGLPMLVYQGAIGFEMWTGCKAPEGVMKAALEKAFGFPVAENLVDECNLQPSYPHEV